MARAVDVAANLIACIAGATVAMGGCTSAHAQGQVLWSVESNFRLLKDPSDQAWLKTLSLDSEDPNHARVKLRDLQNQWKEVPSTHYNEKTSTYDRDYVQNKAATVFIRLDSSSSAYGTNCQWTIQGKVADGPCHDFIAELPNSSSPKPISVLTPSGQQETAVVSIKDILFVALGDSYSAGEGNPDVLRSDSAPRGHWWDTKCRRSLYAWPVLTAARYAQMHPHETVTIVSRACSGAVMKDLTGQINEVAAPPSEGASGQEQLVVNGSRFLEPQLRLVERDLCAQKIEGGDSCPASMLKIGRAHV